MPELTNHVADHRRSDSDVKVDPRPKASPAVSDWPDAELIAAVTGEAPDTAALDALVARYWKGLHGRCQLLTLDRDEAKDLAQETWARVLKSRRSLRADLSFGGYLSTVARNIWCDKHRAARRAGPLADDRLAALDAPQALSSGESVVLGDAVADLASLSLEDEAALKMDIDRALARLEPRARDVLTARFLDGESAAEIAVRYGRTEQTITTWLRLAIHEIKQFLDVPTVHHRQGSDHES